MAPLHSAPPLEGSLPEYCHPIWYRKTRMVGLPDGEKNFEDIYNHLHTIPACVRQMDGQTDNCQTSCYGIVRAMHTRRAVKLVHSVDKQHHLTKRSCDTKKLPTFCKSVNTALFTKMFYFTNEVATM